MISKRIDRNAKTTPVSRFANLVRYIAAEGQKGKCVTMWAVNCLSSPSDAPLDLTMAVIEVTDCQKRYAHTSEDLTYHLLLSFPEGERPSEKELEEIEGIFAEGLGFGEHHRVVAAHDDTENFHLHVAINKVNPETGKVHTPYRDFRIMKKCRAAVEQIYGLQPNPERENTLQSQGARDKEAHSHEQSLERRLREQRVELLKACREARSWEELHRKMKDYELEVRQKGRGLVIGTGDRWVKASSVDRGMSLQRLEKGLGPFVAGKTTKAREKEREATVWQQRRPVYKPKNPYLKKLWRACLAGSVPSWKVYLRQQAQQDDMIRGYQKGSRMMAGWMQKVDRSMARMMPRTYLMASGSEREAVRAAGGRWDQEEQAWYLPGGVNKRKAGSWIAQEPAEQAIDLVVPFGEKEQVKEAGGRWDRERKCWRLSRGGDKRKVQRWIPADPATEETNLFAPYHDKEGREAIRAAGAVWDEDKRCHYLPKGHDRTKVRKWIIQELATEDLPLQVGRKEEREWARAAGARWNGKSKTWYLPRGRDVARVREWLSSGSTPDRTNLEAPLDKVERERTVG